MKKTFKITILLLTLMLACVLVFAACDKGGDNETGDTTAAQTSAQTESAAQTPSNNSGGSQNNSGNNTNTTPTVNPVVTAAKWKNAFDLTRFESFTFGMSETEKEGTNVFEEVKTIKYNNGMLYVRSSEKQNKVENHTTESYFKETPEDIGDLRSDWMSQLWYELRAQDDLGYSLFTFSKNDLSYTAELDIVGDPTKVTIRFANGNITEITSEQKNGENEYLYSYRFTDLNRTEEVEIPAHQISFAMLQAKSNIKKAVSCDCFGDLYGESSDDLLYVIKDFVSDMEIGELTNLQIQDGDIYALKYQCAQSTLEFISESIRYDSVTMCFDDGKLYQISIGYYLFNLDYDNGTEEDDTPPETDPPETDPPETDPPETEKEEEKIFMHEIEFGGMRPTLHVGDEALFERVKPSELKAGDVILYEITYDNGMVVKYVRRIADVYEYIDHFEFSAKLDEGYEPYYIDVHQDQVLGRYTGKKNGWY